jgi:hypothetical protein
VHRSFQSKLDRHTQTGGWRKGRDE